MNITSSGLKNLCGGRTAFRARAACASIERAARSILGMNCTTALSPPTSTCGEARYTKGMDNDETRDWHLGRRYYSSDSRYMMLCTRHENMIVSFYSYHLLSQTCCCKTKNEPKKHHGGEEGSGTQQLQTKLTNQELYIEIKSWRKHTWKKIKDDFTLLPPQKTQDRE